MQPSSSESVTSSTLTPSQPASKSEPKADTPTKNWLDELSDMLGAGGIF